MSCPRTQHNGPANLDLSKLLNSVVGIGVRCGVAKKTKQYFICNELILAGKLQLKKLQKKKPEKNSGFDGA